MQYHRVSLCRFVTLLYVVYGEFDGISTESRTTAAKEDATRPQVKTTRGNLRGIVTTTIHERNVSTFLGIPYAEPPVGSLRFRNPVAKEAWNGTWDARADGDKCPQLINGEYAGNEDCLYLNVFTPQLPVADNAKLLPVMFFIHGGAFEYGSNSHSLLSAGYLVDREDIVLVTVNYRLGVLGFLSTGDEAAPGNFGLKDQLLALRWVNANIKNFGGDPAQVTLFGQSAGAACVHLLALSKETTGLFSRYITQSGTALNYWAFQSRSISRKQAYKLGRIMKCSTHKSSCLIDCLRTRDASDILKTRPLFDKWSQYPIIVWTPTQEIKRDGSILTENPLEIWQWGAPNDVPWMNGFVRHDGFVFFPELYANPDFLEDFLENIDQMPYVLQYKDNVADEARFTACIRDYYLNDFSVDRRMILRNITDIASDCQIVYPAHRIAREHRVLMKKPTYLYFFDYRGTFSYTEVVDEKIGNIGAVHCDDLIYLFPQTEALFSGSNLTMTEADHKVRHIMTELWTSFAIHGRPTTSAFVGNVTWEPYSNAENYLRIGNDAEPSVEVGHSFFKDRMVFWDKLMADQASSGDRPNVIDSLLLLLAFACSVSISR